MKLSILTVPLLVFSLLVPTARLQAEPRCFPEAAPAVTACVDERFRHFWEQHGGLPVFGYPLGVAAPDPNRSGASLLQHFERTSFELHPENPAPYDVLLGHAGAELLARRKEDWTTFPKASPSTPHYFAETGHAIAPEFWDAWSSQGLEFDNKPGTSQAESLALFGYPLSEPRVEVNGGDGRSYLTQWFERARFEHHPEHAGTAFEVQLGLLGRELDAIADPEAQPVVPAPTPAPSLPPGGFVEATSTQLTRLGQPVLLKGVNYYPQNRPWTAMWAAWNGPQVDRELRLAREQLGINTVRILLPYDPKTTEQDGRIGPVELQRLREMVQIAGDLNLRLIVTLFDFDQDVPGRGSLDEQQRFTYLRSILGNFVGDDRIIAWDVHNEPDQYDAWKQGREADMLDWLGRVADEVHRHAPNHLVTVGMSYYLNLLRAGPDGRRPIDYSDMISVHNYNSPDLARQLDELRTHTSKPLVLEEFGWPSGITCIQGAYSEEAQAESYRVALAAATGRVAGVVAWTLRDFDPGPTKNWETREDHYGLYRPDDTLKPAATYFRDDQVPPLPSQVRTNFPLTSTGPLGIAGPQAPLLIPGSNHYVKGQFRLAWELLGGTGSLGPPITEAFVIPGDVPKNDRIVQYFAAGALEFRPEGAKADDFPYLDEAEQVKRLILPLELGKIYAAGRVHTEGGHPIAPRFKSFYQAMHGKWRLGDPITPEMTANLDGATTTVQYFENGRLQVNPRSGVIEAGNLGQLVWQATCDAAR